MFVIVVYDIALENELDTSGQRRLSKILKKCREYFHHVQKSVFEGEINQGAFRRFKTEALQIIDTSKDSLLIYISRTDKYFSRETIGKPSGGLMENDSHEMIL